MFYIIYKVKIKNKIGKKYKSNMTFLTFISKKNRFKLKLNFQ